jgi:hypothetical protein
VLVSSHIGRRDQGRRRAHDAAAVSAAAAPAADGAVVRKIIILRRFSRINSRDYQERPPPTHNKVLVTIWSFSDASERRRLYERSRSWLGNRSGHTHTTIAAAVSCCAVVNDSHLSSFGSPLQHCATGGMLYVRSPVPES